MNTRLLLSAAAIGALSMPHIVAAQASEVRVISSYGMRAVMTEVAPGFERASGHKLAIRYQTPAAISKRMHESDATDVVITTGMKPEQPSIVPGSATPIARGQLVLAVRAGATKPDISSPDALKRALLAAKSISYSQGPAAVVLSRAFDDWGMAAAMKAKTVMSSPPPGTVGELVARGEVEIGVHPRSLLVDVAGIDIAGPLPDEMQIREVATAAVMAGATDMQAAKALIDFLRSPEAAAVIKAKGMQPVSAD